MRIPEYFSDLPPLSAQDQVRFAAKKLTDEWNEEHKKPNPSLVKALLRFLGFRFFVWPTGVLLAISGITAFAPTLFLNWTVKFLQDMNAPLWYGFVLAALIALAECFSFCTFQLSLLYQMRFGYISQNAVTAMVYAKSLRLSPGARLKFTQGEITNYASTDAAQIENAVDSFHHGWSGAVTVIVCLIGLFVLLGKAVFAGLGMMLIIFGLSYFFQRKSLLYNQELMKQRDKRVKLLSETLHAIRIVKFFTWESQFLGKLMNIRKDEIEQQRSASLMWALTDLMFGVLPALVNTAMFVAFVMTGNELTLSVVFTCMSLFHQMKWALVFTPMVLASFVQGKISLDRIQEFMGAEELDRFHSHDGELPSLHASTSAVSSILLEDSNDAIDRDEHSNDGNVSSTQLLALKESLGVRLLDSDVLPVSVSIKKANFSWQADQPPFLVDIDLNVPVGKLAVIIGRVGSGKSSMLNALLGELKTTRGSYHVNGSVAYAPQQPWIIHETVRGNILLGKDMDQDRLSSVVSDCALDRDLEILPGGLSCEIGEKGVSLSGGQKARIALARAVYRDADVYLLDDPFAAVDVHVAKHIYENAVLKALQGKTRILVTHHTFTLPSADLIIVMNEGKIQNMGTYQELLNQGVPLIELMSESSDSSKLHSSGGIPGATVEESVVDKLAEEDDEDEVASGKSIRNEERETGAVRTDVIKAWVKHMGWGLAAIVLIGITVEQALVTARDWYLSDWAEQGEEQGGVKNVYSTMGTYIVVALTSAVITFVEEYASVLATTTAASALHDSTIVSVFKGTTRFFDTTPIGRILNRFSKDMRRVDGELLQTTHDLLYCATYVVSVTILLVIAAPLSAFAIIPLLFVYYRIQNYFRKTSRELQRLGSIAYSPVLSHFSESLSGVSSIRAYGLERQFADQCHTKVDDNMACLIPLFQVNRWIGIRLGLLSAGITFAGVIAGTMAKHFGFLQPALYGLALTYAIPMVESFNWGVRMIADFETGLTGVERLLQYNAIEHEQEIASERRVKVSKHWPRYGKVDFKNVVMRYRPELEPALRGVSFSIKSGSKIGICGRTGSGKSSLLLTLFRMVELESGAILIDGKDIASVPMSRLRASISIIPQDPILFSGTIRSNLDPFNEFSDEEIWDVLRRASMKDRVSSLDEQLDAEIHENGSNLSVGERQLMCLARALCHKAKIIVLDEATSSVDFETDEKIQRTIASEFHGYTVITVAHRMNTIRDYDQILVMQDGVVAEIGAPEDLLADSTSKFYRMINSGFTSNMIVMRPPWYKHRKEHADSLQLYPYGKESKTYWGHMGLVQNPKDDLGLEYNNVSFPSANEKYSYTLRGWVVPTSASSPTPTKGIIMVHGGGHDRRECLRIVPFFNAAGYPALLYDNSEHGISDGDGYGLGFGYREKMDLIGAVQYAKRELGWDKIVVFGTSVGAATTLKAAALDPRIDAVVAENPFTSAEDLWKYAIRRALGTAGFGGRDISRFGKAAELIMKIGPLIPESFFDLVVWLTKWRIGALGHPNTIDIVDKISPRPILLIHSKADDVIPYQHSEALYAKAGQPKEIYITETGSHAAVYNDHKEEFTRKVLTFVKKAIGENKVAEPTKTPSSPASA